MALTDGLSYVDPRQFGLGTSTPTVLTTLAQVDSQVVNGKWAVSGVDLGTGEGVVSGTLEVSSRSGNRTIQEIKTDSNTFSSRFSNDSGSTWSSWKRIDPQAFGVGGDAVPSVDWDNPQTTQAIVSNVNGPNGAIGFLGFNTKSGGNSVAFVGRNSEFYARTIQDGTPQAWQPIYTGANYQPETINGLGVVRFMQNASGANFNSGSTISGSLLRQYYIGSAIAITPFAVGDSGTWKNVGTTVTNNQGTWCVRIA